MQLFALANFRNGARFRHEGRLTSSECRGRAIVRRASLAPSTSHEGVANGKEDSVAAYTQANRPLGVTTPLGEDALLLVGFQGHEAISQLFRFQLALLAAKETAIAFDKIVGQPATVKLVLPGGGTR